MPRISQRDLLPQAIKNRNVFSKKRGKGYIKVDTANKRIIVHDGTTNRIVIGFVEEE